MPYSLRIEVDQSGKIETPHLTVLAYANGQVYTILIPTRVKREVLGRLRVRGLSRSLAAIRMFAVALWLLLRDVIDTTTAITIDTEYIGHEADIKAALLRLAWQRGSQIAAIRLYSARSTKSQGAQAGDLGLSW